MEMFHPFLQLWLQKRLSGDWDGDGDEEQSW